MALRRQLVLFAVSGALGFPVTAMVAILLGGILASTDPAAIIPVLQGVKFKRADA